MKITIRNLNGMGCIAALFLWGCSGSNPATSNEASKQPPAAQMAPEAAQAGVPLKPTADKEEAPSAPVRKVTPPRKAAPPKSTETAATLPSPAPEPPAPVPVPVLVPQAALPVAVPSPIPAPVQGPMTQQVTIPEGTELYIRTIDAIRSEGGRPGEIYHASLDQPIVVDNQVIAAKGADVDLRLVDVQSAGKVKGTSELKVQLDKIYVDKKPYSVISNTYVQTGASAGQQAARNVGIGAAVGGILGGIFGGKKGAVIGAGAGGGGGAVVSQGEQISIDSETQLMFRLENPLEVTLSTTPPPPRNRSGGPIR